MVKKDKLDIFFKINKEQDDFIKLKESFKKKINKLKSNELFALTKAIEEWAKERGLC